MEHYVSKQVPCNAYRMLMISSILAGCVFISGCKGYATTWSAKSQSPDKHFIASASTVQNSGFGSASVDTAVYLTQRGLSPVMILGLHNKSGTTAVDMNWITPTHLNIVYRGDATIDFQSVKCAGVEITVEKKVQGAEKGTG